MATVLRIPRSINESPREVLQFVDKRSFTQVKKMFYVTTVQSKIPMDDAFKVKIIDAFLRKQKQLNNLQRFEKRRPISSTTGKFEFMTLRQSQSCSNPSKSAAHNHRRQSTPLRLNSTFTSSVGQSSKQINSQHKSIKNKNIVSSSRQRLSGIVNEIANSRNSKDLVVYDIYFCYGKLGDFSIKRNDFFEARLDSEKNAMTASQKTDPKCKKKIKSEKSKKRHKSKKKTSSKNCVDDDSMDEEERRFIMDEEDYFLDSDEYDVTGRDDDDVFHSYFDTSRDVYENISDIEYEDNFETEIGFEQDFDHTNDFDTNDYMGEPD